MAYIDTVIISGELRTFESSIPDWGFLKRIPKLNLIISTWNVSIAVHHTLLPCPVVTSVTEEYIAAILQANDVVPETLRIIIDPPLQGVSNTDRMINRWVTGLAVASTTNHILILRPDLIILPWRQDTILKDWPSELNYVGVLNADDSPANKICDFILRGSKVELEAFTDRLLNNAQDGELHGWMYDNAIQVNPNWVSEFPGVFLNRFRTPLTTHMSASENTALIEALDIVHNFLTSGEMYFKEMTTMWPYSDFHYNIIGNYYLGEYDRYLN